MINKDNDVQTISIITPSFNQGQFIEDTIKSVLIQDGDFRIEYLIIDGGSTDNSLEIIKKYDNLLKEGAWQVKCQSIDYKWISEKDRGQTDAINKGFKMATGDIVAWINSDDYYFPGVLNRVAELFRRDLNVDVLYGDCVFVDEKGQFLRYFTEVEDFNIHRLLNYSDYIMQPTTFFKRSALEKVNYLNEELHYTMDWDLWCRLGKSGSKFKYMMSPIAVNRDYELTKTSTGKFKRWYEILKHNIVHKTTIFPWAALNYGLWEIHLNSTNNEMINKFKNYLQTNNLKNIFKLFRLFRRFARIIIKGLRKIKRIIFKTRRPLNLYGLEPHGNLLDHNFTLMLPWYNSIPHSIEIYFDYIGNGEGKINLSLNGSDSREVVLSQADPIHVNFKMDRDEYNYLINIQGEWSMKSSSEGSLKLKSMNIQ